MFGAALRAVAAATLFIATALPPASAWADDIDAKVEALLQRMTLEEKIGQLTLTSAGDRYDPDLVRQGKVGAVMNFGMPDEVAEVQRLADKSRLRIPPLIGLDIVHGYRTLFPIPLAEAATFDPELARLGSELSAREARAAGIEWTFGPMADLSRDVRWGRIVEGAGEDPHLLSVMTKARVEGFSAGGLATTTKHFVGYGAAVGGRDYDAAYIPGSEMRDIYVPPFRVAIGAGTESIMVAYTALDGLPVAANPEIIQGLLRDELGFKGFVISDYNVAGELMNHGLAATPADAVRIAFLSGVQMEMYGGLYAKHLPDEVEAGRVPLSLVDDAVRAVLRAKFRLGLFDRAEQAGFSERVFEDLPEAREVARQMAADSMVLLQNRKDLLPIRPDTKSIALIGPLADSPRDQNGPHEARAVLEDTITFRHGLRERAEGAGMAFRYVSGCADLYCNELQNLDDAEAAARSSDLAVLVLGEPRDLTGEGGSRAHLTLPGRQQELIDRIVATDTPVALVLMAGRPLEIGPVLEQVSSVLMAWYPGTEGGPALADILFGEVSPSGRLPHTWPRAVGQVPIHYDRLPTGRPTEAGNRFTLKYVDEEITPQFPFGWGLSYTDFSYSDLRVLTPEVKAEDELKVSVTLTNTGKRRGKEVAQLYVRDPVASRSRPVRQLKGFEKVELEPGERREITFTIAARELGFYLPDGKHVVEPGAFRLWVGGNAAEGLETRFEIVE